MYTVYVCTIYIIQKQEKVTFITILGMDFGVLSLGAGAILHGLFEIIILNKPDWAIRCTPIS